jgi:hypothetical protein
MKSIIPEAASARVYGSVTSWLIRKFGATAAMVCQNTLELSVFSLGYGLAATRQVCCFTQSTKHAEEPTS